MKNLWNKYESFAKVENVSKYYQFWSEIFELYRIYDDVTNLIIKISLFILYDFFVLMVNSFYDIFQ